jgi:hypothetical protein
MSIQTDKPLTLTLSPTDGEREDPPTTPVFQTRAWKSVTLDMSMDHDDFPSPLRKGRGPG